MFLLILLIIFQSSQNPIIFAADNETIYAKILFDETYLYRNIDENQTVDNIYFELPKTYFVELLSLHGDYYKARYLDIFGYVKKDRVQAVAKTPQIPFLTTVTFRVYSAMSQSLRLSPSANANIITEIPLLTKNIQFLGAIKGESLIEGRTNIWYYCKYTSNNSYYGYVYSDFCDEMPQIAPNMEEIEFVSNPTFQVTQINNTIPLENKTSIGLVVAALSIPALIFIFLILNGTKILSNTKTKSKEVVDY